LDNFFLVCWFLVVGFTSTAKIKGSNLEISHSTKHPVWDFYCENRK
jgi:hypothetical protein